MKRWWLLVLVAALLAGCAAPPATPLAPITIPPQVKTAIAATLAVLFPSPTSTPPPATPLPEPTPTLRSLAEARGLWLGVAADPRRIADDAGYAGLLLREFNALTPEVAMKFEVIHPERERYDFTHADALVEYAVQHDLMLRGHPLVWENQLPPWIVQGEFSREEWIAILHAHITTLVSRYRGRVPVWDVVNEALDADGQLRDNLWLRAIGPEYIALAFQWAHAADPAALLFLNEHQAEGLNPKSDAVYALLQELLAAGVPVHGVGLQMHLWFDGDPAYADLLANMQRLGELGLQVHITEMDVRVGPELEARPARLEAQALRYAEALRACLQVEACNFFGVWGLTDRYSWIPSLTGQADAPLLFDESMQPKPAYAALLAELKQ